MDILSQHSVEAKNETMFATLLWKDKLKKKKKDLLEPCDPQGTF